jgi:hypothetical protein
VQTLFFCLPSSSRGLHCLVWMDVPYHVVRDLVCYPAARFNTLLPLCLLQLLWRANLDAALSAALLLLPLAVLITTKRNAWRGLCHCWFTAMAVRGGVELFCAGVALADCPSVLGYLPCSSTYLLPCCTTGIRGTYSVPALFTLYCATLVLRSLSRLTYGSCVWLFGRLGWLVLRVRFILVCVAGCRLALPLLHCTAAHTHARRSRRDFAGGRFGFTLPRFCLPLPCACYFAFSVAARNNIIFSILRTASTSLPFGPRRKFEGRHGGGAVLVSKTRARAPFAGTRCGLLYTE